MCNMWSKMEAQRLKIQMDLYQFSCWLHFSVLTKIHHIAEKLHRKVKCLGGVETWRNCV